MLVPVGRFSCSARCLGGLRAGARLSEGEQNGDVGGEGRVHQDITRAEVDVRDEERELVLTVQASSAGRSEVQPADLCLSAIRLYLAGCIA